MPTHEQPGHHHPFDFSEVEQVQHTLIALLQDRPGVLNRAVSLFRRRGFNIASLAVGHSEVPGVSRMTLVVDCEHVEQVVKQLDRLIDVLAVHDITHERSVEQETCLVKVTAASPDLAELVQVARESGAPETARRAADLPPGHPYQWQADGASDNEAA